MKTDEAKDIIRQIGNIISRDESWSDAAKDAVKEAFAMATNSLRQQDPRVLSFNELKFDTVYWIELKDVMPWPVAMEKMRGNPEYLVFVDYHGDKWDAVKYCVEKGGWRCWTARPTDEQRKNTPWR